MSSGSPVCRFPSKQKTTKINATYRSTARLIINIKTSTASAAYN